MNSKIGSKLDESEKQILQMMGASLLKLNNTIGNLIEVTKAQKNLEEQLEPIAIQEIVEDIKDELKLQISESKAKIQEEFLIQELKFAKASLRSIMYNLLSNAIKYRSPERLPVINISTFKEEEHTVLRIQDNGLGLTQKQEAKLFTMFKRFHRHVEGTGIGLYIVKRTIENYGGKIQVRSKLDEGTEFKLYFHS
ncbi:sensor histidine kinase [Catalinimonas niigatensis]|uniref:sensor histidine kinase n=1 Tax=Catalinimonas niigatensis TaxID=1397264 RepID=UPI002666A8E8|nr:ATP-binding protein [Catalinimonas niigatensis]WPP50615.1 ATP-binding protein [Catalinimonas niigatensis]